MKKFDVVCFGALNIDKLYRVDRIAGKEEESVVKGFKETLGGAAANTAVGLARLGLKIGYIGKVANDEAGRLLINGFRKEKVDTNGIVISDKGNTGVVFGYVDKKGDRALYAIPGANDRLQFNEVDLKYAGNCSFLHMTPFVGESPFDAQKRLLKMLPPECKVSFDPGDLYARKGLDTLRLFIGRSHVISLNAKESELLTGKGYRKGANILMDMGAHTVSVKLGSRGCYITNGENAYFAKAFPSKVIDTTGAGEAFCAGFLLGLIKDRNLLDCAKLGNFVASCCISKLGAREGLPFLSQLAKARIL